MPSPESRLSNATNTSHGIAAEQVFKQQQQPRDRLCLEPGPASGDSARESHNGTGTMYFAGPKPEEKMFLRLLGIIDRPVGPDLP